MGKKSALPARGSGGSGSVQEVPESGGGGARTGPAQFLVRLRGPQGAEGHGEDIPTGQAHPPEVFSQVSVNHTGGCDEGGRPAG